MASTGGAWAMIRKTFLALGGYDPGMSAWGGEDFEMALRVCNIINYCLNYLLY